MYMQFKNQGEIDTQAFKLLGASSKRGEEGKIGFFGTGLKYAIALLLREEVDFKVFVGKKEVVFGTNKTKFRGKNFDVITVDGHETGFTTEAAIDWEPWFAIREIFSNTLDEGGAMELTEDVKSYAGHTVIYVDMSEKLGDVSRNWQDYFAMKRPALSETAVPLKDSLFSTTDAEKTSSYRVLAKRDTDHFILFRRGIRAFQHHQRSLFDYDVTYIDINESRVVKNSYEAFARASEALARTTNPEIIERFIAGWRESGMIEHENHFWSYTFEQGRLSYMSNSGFSDAWLEALKGWRVVPNMMTGFYGVTKKTVALPQSLIDKLYKQFGDKLTIVGTSKEHYIETEAMHESFKLALQLLKNAGYIFDPNNITMGKFRDNDTKGMWDKNKSKIVLNETTVGWSNREKALLLMEEIFHADSGASDNTRQFQNYIFGKLVDKIIDYEAPLKKVEEEA